ncbi:type I restriction-modification system subunit M N-terminal domain-containing protein [Polynucleobacter sp. es-GGE-1]|uniref:type I restriction-modification system subunit M N-terminal domain-containing protein n=1 Tax=Polynucleobacter sp. es-GGE-1 TaxID=1819724 RepID=UPI001C0C293E|nr:type I restriction-modification system subunit M N-terminal domain-containing protein [Polynucleobacter sp. es-GGE-1]
MFEKAFKNIDTILKNDGGSSTELDYTEQTSWILFLKYLDALEQDKALAADLAGMTCLVLSDQSHLETLAPVINSFCHPATNSVGV